MMTFDNLTLEQKVGQLLFPSVHPAELSPGSDAWNALQESISTFHLGGIHVFRSRAIEVAELSNRMQRASRLPVLLTVPPPPDPPRTSGY